MGMDMRKTSAGGFCSSCRPKRSCSIAWAKHGGQSLVMRTSRARSNWRLSRCRRRASWRRRTSSISLQAQRCKRHSPGRGSPRHRYWKVRPPAGWRSLTGDTKRLEMACILMVMKGRMSWLIDARLLSGGGVTNCVSITGTMPDMNSHAQSDSQCPMASHSDSSSSRTTSPRSTKTTTARSCGLTQAAGQHHSPKAMASPLWSRTFWHPSGAACVMATSPSFPSFPPPFHFINSSSGRPGLSSRQVRTARDTLVLSTSLCKLTRQ